MITPVVLLESSVSCVVRREEDIRGEGRRGGRAGMEQS